MEKQKKLKFNIFWKTFSITIVMLMGVTFIAFTFIYLFLPIFYQSHEISTYNAMINSHIIELENTVHLDDEVYILNEIFRESNSSFSLSDSDSNLLFHNYISITQTLQHTGGTDMLDYNGNEVSFESELSDDTEIKHPNENDQHEDSFNEGDLEIGAQSREWVIEVDDGFSPLIRFSMPTVDFEYTFLNLTFEYKNRLGDNRTLEVSIPLSPLADTQNVIMSMYPFAVLLSIVFALIAAFIFSHWIATPIKRIQAATSKMSRLEPNVAIAIKSQDEIGMLSNDISQLYEQLRGTIVTLEQEISRYSAAENKKIEFLQSVSHEMKTPLASANSLLEGIIYEVSPYCDKPKQYLIECRDFLQKTIQLTKESLNLSEQYKKPEALYNLADIVKEASNLYGVIFMVKQVSYYEYIPGNVFIRTKDRLLVKVLSNLFSNAANYTSEGGQVRVSYEDGVLTIFNSCDPLSQEKVDEIFKPLMTQNASEHATGLGLFIVKQLLRQLKIKFTFSESADGRGMAFNLWLPVADE